MRRHTAFAATALLAPGCRSPAACAPARDPLREVGVDCRGLVEHDPARIADGRQVLLDMTVARIPEGRVASALGADRPRRAGLPVTVSGERARVLVAGWRRAPAIEVTSGPRLLALPDQQASVIVGETVRLAKTGAATTGVLVRGSTLDGETFRYARTAAVTDQDGGLTFSIEESPQEPVDLGMRIVVLANLDEDGRRITLGIAGSWRELKQGIAPEALARMTAAELEPHVREHRLDTRFEMPSGGWVVVGNPAWIETDGGRVLQIVLLHAVVLDGGEKPPVG